MTYAPAPSRHEQMLYNRSGGSGLKLPALSLGLWNNFGHDHALDGQRAVVRRAFDLGITHFDLANNYGPPYGSAGELRQAPVRGPRALPRRARNLDQGRLRHVARPQQWGSRKYLLASLDQSLRRLGLDYVDIFYSHRVDPETPLEETMGALDTAVRQGKALYIGISSYSAARTREARRSCGSCARRS